MSNKEYKLYNEVKLGSNCEIGPWVELGIAPGKTENPLVIGDNAFIRSHTIIYTGTSIGQNFSTGHGALIQKGVKIGNDVSVGSGSEIEHDVTIGNGVRIHSHCFIAQKTIIEDNVRISPGVNITSTKHPLLPPDKKHRQGPHIERNVYVGMGATILSGLRIGENSFIGAGAVVTKNVPSGVVVIGNPARIYMTTAEYLKKLETK